MAPWLWGGSRGPPTAHSSAGRGGTSGISAAHAEATGPSRAMHAQGLCPLSAGELGQPMAKVASQLLGLTEEPTPYPKPEVNPGQGCWLRLLLRPPRCHPVGPASPP